MSGSQDEPPQDQQIPYAVCGVPCTPVALLDAAAGRETFATRFRLRIAEAAIIPPNIAPATPDVQVSAPARNRFRIGVRAPSDRKRNRSGVELRPYISPC